MSVNLKLRKSAQSEQEAPAPELVMAGGQTPWGPTPTTPPPSGNPFSELGAANGLPSMPPPPPPFAPGEEPAADAPAGRKVNPRLLAAAVAVVVALGGGYFYLNSGSGSDSGTTSNASTLAAAKARAAALRAKAAAHAAAATSTAVPAAGAAKPTAGAKAPAAAAPKTKAPVVAKPKAKTPPAKTAPAKKTKKAKVSPTGPDAIFHTALPAVIGTWTRDSKSSDPGTLVKYDKKIGTSPGTVSFGEYDGEDGLPRLDVTVADHTPKPTQTALSILKGGLPELTALGIVVATPEAVTTAGWGGTAACTTATKNDVLMVVCAWIDNGTIGQFVAYHSAESQESDLLELVRASVES